MRPMGVEKENCFLSLCLAGVSFLTLREKNILLKNLDSAAALALLSIDCLLYTSDAADEL